jgi:hypothetical protein
MRSVLSVFVTEIVSDAPEIALIFSFKGGGYLGLGSSVLMVRFKDRVRSKGDPEAAEEMDSLLLELRRGINPVAECK